MKPAKVHSYPASGILGAREQFMPYHLPAGGKGEFVVEHRIMPRGEKMSVVSMRNAIFMGMPPRHIVLSEPTAVHYLRQYGAKHSGTWMSTIPQEVEQHARQLAGFKGTVLMGGLGLGVGAALLARSGKVGRIDIVEKSRAVIDLVAPHLKAAFPQVEINLIHADIYKFLRDYNETPRKVRTDYDYAFFDTWCGTGETTLVKEVMPLRQLVAKTDAIPQDHIECWNEDEMLGQVALGMQTQLLMRQSGHHGLLTDDEASRKVLERALASDTWVRPDRAWLKWARHQFDQGKSFEFVARSVNPFIHALKNAVVYNQDWQRYE